MKRIVMLMFVAILMLMTGCSVMRVTVHTAEEVIKGAAPKAQVSSPLAEQLGVSFPGHNMVVGNTTPFYAKVIAYGNEAARLNPWDVGYDNRTWEPLNSVQIPFTVLFYKDAACTDYVGVATHSFSISSGTSESQNWLIDLSEIQTPTGEQIRPELYPSPAVRPEGIKVKFHREWWNATVGVPMVNNTYFLLTIMVNGEVDTTLTTGGFYYFAKRNYSSRGYTKTVQLFLTDSSRPKGAQSVPFWVPSDGIFAYPIVIGPNNVQY